MPVDLEDLQMDVYLVQLVQDGPIAPILRLTLVDVEIYLPGGSQPVTYTRNVQWLPNFVNRLSLFRLLHLEQHCHDTPDRCHLYLNDFEIEQDPAATMDIEHGHYVNVYIGACDSNLLDQMLQEEEVDDQMQLLQCPVNGIGRLNAPLWKSRTDQPVEPPRPEQWCQARGRDRQNTFRPTPPWGIDLIRRFEAEAFVEVEEEGHVAYIVTWLVQHVRQPICNQPRTVRLGDNPADWESNIVDAWNDLIDHRLDLHLHHVRPRPIQATTQTILGHVIVEQEETPTITVALTTIHSSTETTVRLRQIALGIPRLLSRASLLQRLPLPAVERDRIPFFRVHLNEIPFGLFEIEEVEPGTHLDIFPPSYRPDLPAASPRFVTLEDNHDLLNFMQSNVILRSTTTSLTNGMHSECHDDTILSTTSTTVPFQFNPNANEFAMPRPALHSQSEFVQELFEPWQRSAAAWDGEVRSCTIATWYVNHRWPRPHGHYHRRVQLYENYQAWEDSIRATWRDQIDPNAETDFYLVYPSPLSGTNDITAHVIMIQYEHPLWVTSLVSVIDDDRRQDDPVVQLAVTTHEHILFESVLLATELVDSCLGSMGHPATHVCQMWHQDTELFRGQPCPGRNGLGIHVHIRRQQQPPPVHPGMNLLQRYTRLITARPDRRKEQEGLTDEQVAHTHRPCLPLTTAIRIYSGRPEHSLLPDFIEVARPATATSIQQELTHWGHTCEVDLLEDLDIAFAYIINGELQKTCKIFFSIANGQIIGPYYYLEPPQLENETIDMKFLHSNSHPKAVITSYRASLHSTVIANFQESFGTLEEHTAKPRQPPDWPVPQPVAPSCHMYPQSTLEVAHTDRDSRVKIGKTTEELCELFHCSNFPWHTNFEDLQLPVELHLFLNSIPLLGDVHPDRYIIYVDGSLQGQQQHHPTAWIEEHGIPDAWAMIVLAERYATPDQTHQLFLVGWTAQQVRYDSASRFYIGSTIPGSLTAEREGMTWAFLWRIGQNNMVPTLFRSDSQLTCDQASGSKGATILDDSFLCLRGAYQLLDTALPRGHLELEHIYGHCGEPFNDFTDLMAKQEALSSFYLPRLKIDMTSWRTKLPHLWLLFAQHLGGPQHYDGYLHTPVPNLPNPETASPSMNPTRTQGMIHIKIQLSLCTANVLSMYNRPEGYAGKVGYLVEQFQAHCLLFGGIQEARTPEGSCRCQNTLRLCSGASQGQGGVELWINLIQPYGYEGRIPLLLKQENVQVLHADPQRLLARVVATHLDIFVLVGHAPHSGHPQATRSTWWTSTTELLHDLCGENKPYVMIDANAEPGSADGCSVLNTTCTTSKSTPLWRQFLAEHQLALPQTLPLHVGGLATWISPEGSTTHCLDYVAVPVERLPCCTSSQLLESLDLGNEQQDHTPVAVELEWDFHAFCPNPPERQLKDNFDRTIIRTAKMDGFLENFPTMDWATDVDTQVQTFNRAVHGDLHRLCPTRRRGPKKSFINEEIWKLRASKLTCRKALKHTRKIIFRELLATSFQAWQSCKHDHHQYSFAPHRQYMTTLLCGTLRRFVEYRKFAKQLKNDLKLARHQGVADHVDKLPPTASASTILHTLRPLVGTSNLKNKGIAPLPQVLDREGRPCASPEAALDRWIEFFGNMEGGIRVQAQQQRDSWIQNLKHLNSEKVEIALEELPSLTALESAYRQVSTGKATGPDNIPAEACNTCPTEMARHTYPLLLKTLLHGHEPLLHKGGRLVPIWKRKLSKQRCEAYRSILISSHVGKCIHRTLRLHQATVYEKYLVRQQIGGQRKAPVTLGVHLTRAYFRHHHLQQRPVALIFLDLSEAFYRVMRPLAVGGCADDETLALMAARLGLPDAILEDLRQHLTEDHATKEAKLPRHLQRALQALHLDTHWHIGQQQDACCTTMGTRPGDAFADVIFGYLWSRVLQNFQQEADADGTTFDAFPADQGPNLFGCPVETEEMPHKFLGPCWMDDLCVAMSADHCETLLRKTRCSASLLIDKCLSHAMKPNLAAGKTEILLAFRGKGARKARIAHYGPLASRQLHVIGEYDTYPIRLVGQYQHLGCIIHHCGDLRKEINSRIAMAHKTFSTHRKVLFHNGAIELSKRVELFESLVLSKFLYGTESWAVPDIKTKEHLHSALIRLFRRLLPLSADCHLTDDQILHQTGLKIFSS